MSDLRSSLVSHPATKVSFTVRRPSPLSRQSSTGPDSDGAGRSSSFRAPTSTSNGLNSPLRQEAERTSSAKPRFQTHSFHRHDDQDDSDEDEDNGTTDELVTGFDELGVQRATPRAKPSGPLVIPALANRDWRAVVRARQAATGYVPDGAKSAVIKGADGSQGGLGTRDTINSGPQLQGLVFKSSGAAQQAISAQETPESEDVIMYEPAESENTTPQLPESLDDLALRSILQGVSASEADGQEIELDAIPMAKHRDEATALKEDVAALPDVASLDDYARVPVEQFGAALLRGMGWKEGTAASRTRKGVIEPYLPQQRPALLGIGAKPRPAEDVPSSSGSGKHGGQGRRENRKYIPLIKREALDPKSNGSTSAGRTSRRSSRSRSPPDSRNRSRTGSRRPSRSPSPSDRRDRDRERDRDRHRDKERDRGGERDDRYRSRRRLDEDDGGYSDRDRRERDRRRDREHSERSGDRDNRSPRRS